MPFFRKSPERSTAPPPLRFLPVLTGATGLSTGNRDLDDTVRPAASPGRVIGIEGQASVAPNDFLLLAVPAIAQSLLTGHGALVVPPAGVLPAVLRDQTARIVPRALFDERARIVDYQSVEASEPWRVPMAGLDRNHAMRAMIKAEHAVRGPANAPFLELSALDTMENVVGPDVAVRMLTAGLTRIKEVGNLGLCWTRSGLRSLPSVQGIADDWFELLRRDDALCVRGIRPAFGPRKVRWEEAGGELHLGLELATE